MPLRNRNGKFHYRFSLDGKEYSGRTGFAATKSNVTAARFIEAEHRRALLEGRQTYRRILIRQFDDAAKEFLDWAQGEYRAHPSSHRRIAVSFTSARLFFDREPVSMIDESRVEAYKSHRIREHGVRDVTLRHDLHALSTFFRYAIKQGWTRENPIRKVNIPSDADAVRIHVIAPDEEREYFRRAAKHADLFDLARLMLNQGARPDELIGLLKADVDLGRGQIKIRRGKSAAARRTLALTSESHAILANRVSGSSPWVFPSRRQPSQHIGRLNGAHDRLCENALEAGVVLAFVLYDFRHTFATRMAQAGIDLATLAAILGHSSIRLVGRYVHPTDEHQRTAMARYDEVLKAAGTKQVASSEASVN
jgi:integrase